MFDFLLRMAVGAIGLITLVYVSELWSMASGLTEPINYVGYVVVIALAGTGIIAALGILVLIIVGFMGFFAWLLNRRDI